MRIEPETSTSICVLKNWLRNLGREEWCPLAHGAGWQITKTYIKKVFLKRKIVEFFFFSRR